MLVTGELRFASKGHFQQFMALSNNSNVWVATYPEYHSVGLRLCRDRSKRLIVTSREEASSRLLLGVKQWVHPGDTYHGLEQWVHLDRLLQVAGSQLLHHSLVVKVRTDLTFRPEGLRLSSLHPPDENTVVAQSDLFFYARGRTFVRAYSGMLNASVQRYTWPSSCPIQFRWVVSGCVPGGTENCSSWQRSDWRRNPSHATKFASARGFNSETAMSFHLTVASRMKCLEVPEFRVAPLVDCDGNKTWAAKHACRSNLTWGRDS